MQICVLHQKSHDILPSKLALPCHKKIKLSDILESLMTLRGSAFFL